MGRDMRITALNLGILGGVVGLLVTALILVTAALATTDARHLVVSGALVLACAIVGLVLVGPAREKPRLAASLLLLSGLVLLYGVGGLHMVLITPFAPFLIAPFLIVAGLVAACGVTPRPAERDRRRERLAEITENRGWLERQAPKSRKDAR